MYAFELGVELDYMRGYMRLNIAASQGLKQAKEYRNRIRVEMTPAQVEKGQRLARECVRKNYKGC